MAMDNNATMRAQHESAWNARIEAGGGLEVEGDLWLAQSLNASLYFIRSSIRADWPHGLSPGGLASNGYVRDRDERVWHDLIVYLYAMSRAASSD
jgi:hypothetical protein